jgi:acyl-coenzyme A thioesterase PaaI-like protein
MSVTRDASHCFVCGPSNPIGLHVAFSVRDGRVTGEFTPSALHVGFAGIVHGGILAAVLDDAMAWVGYGQREPTVTARLSVRYRQPARPGETLQVEAEEVGRRRGVRNGRALLRRGDGVVVADAEAVLADAPADA